MTEQEKEFLFKIDVKTLLDVTRTLKEFVSEARFNLNNEGLRITELEPANVCLIDIELKKYKFQQLTEQEQVKTYGVNTEWLYNALKENKKENVEITTQDNKLFLRFDNGINSEISLIELEQQEQKKPELEFKTKIEIDSKRLNEVLKHFCSNSDSIVFNPLKEGFKIYSQKGFNDSKVKLNLDEVNVSGEEVKAKYSTEYLKKFIKVVFADKTILEFSTDAPLKFEQKTQGLRITYILAPRVESDD